MQAAKIGLPEREAQKFLLFYESKGWKVGKSPMKQWRSALAGWKLRWEEKPDYDSRNGLSATTAAILRQKELDEVQKKMNSLRNSYCDHQAWAEEDKDKWRKLRDRKVELKKLLGMQV